APAGGGRGPRRAGAHLSLGLLAARVALHPRVAGRGLARLLVLRAAAPGLERAAMILDRDRGRGRADLNRRRGIGTPARITALIAALCLLPRPLRAGTDDWFHVYQYTPRTVILRATVAEAD